MLRYIFWLAAIIGLIIILIILILPGGKKVTPTNASSLVSYASTDTLVRLTIDGPEVSNQQHQSVEVTVGQNDVRFEQLSGYNGQVTAVQDYPNTQASYNVFLHTLYYAGFTIGENTNKYGSELGYCPLGDRYIYEIINGSSDVQRYWSTSCGSPATFKGNPSLVLTLFQKQVPNYSQLTQNANI